MPNDRASPHARTALLGRHLHQRAAPATTPRATRAWPSAWRRSRPKQPGFLGIESVRDAEGVGITLSATGPTSEHPRWKRVAAHTEAQRLGHARWYADFVTAHRARRARLHAPTAHGYERTRGARSAPTPPAAPPRAPA